MYPVSGIPVEELLFRKSRNRAPHLFKSSSMNFNRNEIFVDETSLATVAHKKSTGTRGGGIPTSKDITGIEVRLSKVLIKDNGTERIWPFPGLAKMYLLTVVVSDLQEEPVLLDLKGFAKVGDNEELPVDRTLFYWKKDKGDSAKAPGQIHVFASVIKSKQALREVGEILSEVKGDPEYNDLMSNISSLINKANPVGTISDTVFTAATIVGKYLSGVDDKPWFTWVQSFTDVNGDMDNLGATVRGRESEKVAMTLSLIIRDKGREAAILKGLTEEQQDRLL